MAAAPSQCSNCNACSVDGEAGGAQWGTAPQCGPVDKFAGNTPGDTPRGAKSDGGAAPPAC